PSTVREIVCTASKSPGEVIGKPASITSTPRRVSCCAISSFSWVFSEMPGDCSPSRSVVSKISTRLGSSGLVMSLLSVSDSVSSRCCSRGYVRPPTRYSPRGGRRRSRRSRLSAMRRTSVPSSVRHDHAVRKLALIVNPVAGGGRPARALPQVQAELRARGFDQRFEYTKSLAHARELALQAAAAGEVAVAFGGDGLISAVAGALRGSDGLVGILPGGRGNDLCRVLGIPRGPVAACGV